MCASESFFFFLMYITTIAIIITTTNTTMMAIMIATIVPPGAASGLSESPTAPIAAVAKCEVLLSKGWVVVLATMVVAVPASSIS